MLIYFCSLINQSLWYTPSNLLSKHTFHLAHNSMIPVIISSGLRWLDCFLLCSMKHCSQLVGHELRLLACRNLLVCYLGSSYSLILQPARSTFSPCSQDPAYCEFLLMLHSLWSHSWRQTLWMQKSHLYLLCLLTLPSGVNINNIFWLSLQDLSLIPVASLSRDTKDSLMSFCSFAILALSHWRLMMLHWPKQRVWAARV